MKQSTDNGVDFEMKLLQQNDSARYLLEKMLKGEKVSRWKVFPVSGRMFMLIRTEPRYKDLKNDVQDHVEMALESL